MWISGWHIDGFGRFHDEDVRDLPRGLVVFEGPNEAGKSTLLAFLRAVLFGGPTNGKEPRYPPLRGGVHGGRVFLETPEGTVTIGRRLDARRPPQVRLQDGTPLSEEELRRILGGVDAHLFRSVFAIGLSELQSFAELDAESVRDRIFSAAVVGAGRSARRVDDVLAQQQEALLRSRAAGRIAELEQRLARTGAELAEARRKAGEYTALRAEEAGWLTAIRELDGIIAAARGTERRYQTLLALWPLHLEIDKAGKNLAALPAMDGFPADALARFDRLRADLRSAGEEVEASQRTLADVRAQAAALRAGLEEMPASVVAEVEALHEALPSYRELVGRRVAAAEAHRQDARAVQQALATLGEGWTEARVARLDCRKERRAEVRQWAAALQAARERESVVLADETAARGAADEATELSRRAKQRASAPAPVDVTDLAREDELLRGLRADCSELGATAAKYEEFRLRLEQRELALRQAEATPVKALPKWLPGVVAAITALLVVGALVFVWVGIHLGALLLAPLALLGTAGIALIWRAGTRAEEQRVERENLLHWRRTVIAHEADALALEERKLASFDREVRREAAHFRIDAVPSAERLDELAAGLAAQREALRRWEEARAEAAELDDEARKLTQTWARIGYQRVEAERARRDVETRWAAWASDLRLPDGLAPMAVLDFFEAVRRTRLAIRAREGGATRLGQAEAEAAVWETRARGVLATAAASGGGDPDPAGGPPSDHELPERIVALLAHVRADTAARAGLREAEDAIRRAEDALAAAESRRLLTEAEHAALLRAGGAANEEEFRALLLVWERRQTLVGTIERLRADLDTQIGRGPDADSLRAELTLGRRGEWEAARAAALAELEELASRRDTAVRRHENAERERQRLETSADVAGLEIQRHGIVAELAAAAQEWSVAAIARGLVRSALQEYERTRQPQVLALASRIFEGVTSGRYVRVQQEAQAHDLVVLDRAGGRCRTSELSRGTAEQLYLALRLALAGDFAVRGVPLPIILDDVLVNFDPDRARAMAEALARKAADQQVVLFTCQPTTVEILLDACPEAWIQRLERVEPTTRSADGRLDGSSGRITPRESVLECLRAAGRPLSRAEILVMTGVTEAAWPGLIADLTRTGEVLQIRRRHGATYHLPTTATRRTSAGALGRGEPGLGLA